MPPMDLATTAITGSKPIFVFLHGLGGTRRYWTATSAPLPPFGHGAVLVDLLGFGESPKPWFTYTVERHLDALDNCLRDLGDILIVAHSMGAALAIDYAARHPAHVRGLCVISTTALRWAGQRRDAGTAPPTQIQRGKVRAMAPTPGWRSRNRSFTRTTARAGSVPQGFPRFTIHVRGVGEF